MSLVSPSEFYRRYKDKPMEGKREAFKIGKKMGQTIVAQNNIQGEDLEAVSDLLNSAMRSVHGEDTAKIENNNVIMRNTGFCAIMRAAVTLNLPWEWIDKYFAWPWLEGIVSVIRPDLELSIASARCRGDEECIHVFQFK